MGPYDLQRMVERRGYALEHPTQRHPATYHVFRGKAEIARISVYILDESEVGNIAGYLDRIVSLHHPMQHHMACNTCKTPLLRHVNTDLALELLQNSIHPTWQLRNGKLEIAPPDPAVEAAIRTEYRLASEGPESQPLDYCPACGIPLDERAVCEIRD